MNDSDAGEEPAANETIRTDRRGKQEDDSHGSETDDGGETDHLRDVPVGAGCTEIWDHLSGSRENPSGSNSDSDPDREAIDGD
ncbi:hypothetical protein [Halopenitus persicus]|uniref:hypothetical protein n=1 Tax=Halopenitus persicus TaxID=1048396 RepID=UPI000BBAEC89|nr:hypothetical protein [Halopenitus persicus]